jgi:6-pyruvoyltetrahydropterin/6-carboxytetrahydropterin synthase
MVNGEKEVKLHSVIVHETESGYAQCFAEDAYSKEMGDINLHEIVFSQAVKEAFNDSKLFEKIKDEIRFVNVRSV